MKTSPRDPRYDIWIIRGRLRQRIRGDHRADARFDRHAQQRFTLLRREIGTQLDPQRRALPDFGFRRRAVTPRQFLGLIRAGIVARVRTAQVEREP